MGKRRGVTSGQKKRFGEQIAELRRARGLTQVQLARRVWTTRQSINQIETGDSVPRLLLAFRLARFFHTTAADLCRVFDEED